MSLTFDHAADAPRTPENAISFSVYGCPQPAGSKKAFVNKKTGRAQIVDANAKAKPWKQQVAGSAMALCTTMWTGPVELEVLFVLARPKGHFGSGRNAGALKPSAPEHPTVRPDVDKLSRAVMDALTGIAWRDDAQVVRKTVEKVYGSPERVGIVARVLG